MQRNIDYERAYERMLDMIGEMEVVLKDTTHRFQMQVAIIAGFRDIIANGSRNNPPSPQSQLLLNDSERKLAAAMLTKDTLQMGISHQQQHLRFAIGRAKKFYHDHLATIEEKADAWIEAQDRERNKSLFRLDR